MGIKDSRRALTDAEMLALHEAARIELLAR
jgi:hypothetical protein